MNQALSHPAEGDLFRLLDGECDPDEAAAFHTHVETCQPCGTSYRALQEDVGAVAAALPVADPTPQRVAHERASHAAFRDRTAAPFQVRWRQLALRIAAVVTVAVGAALGASPVRAWIAERIDRWVGGASTEAPAPTVSPADVGAGEATRARATIAFSPDGGAFTLAFATRQETGTVSIGVVEGTGGTIEIVGEDAGDSVLVLPDGIRVTNARGFSADYRISIPALVNSVTLTTVLDVGRLREDGGMTVDLATGLRVAAAGVQ